MNTFLHLDERAGTRHIEASRVGDVIDLILRVDGSQQTTFLSLEAARAVVVALAGQLNLVVTEPQSEPEVDPHLLTGHLRHGLKLGPGVEPPDPSRSVSRGGSRTVAERLESLGSDPDEPYLKDA